MSTEISPSSPSGLPEGLAGHRLLTSDEAALLLGVPVATLRTWRSRRRGYGPRAVQVGGSIRYRPADLLAWIDDHTENPDGNVQPGIEAFRQCPVGDRALDDETTLYGAADGEGCAAGESAGLREGDPPGPFRGDRDDASGVDPPARGYC